MKAPAKASSNVAGATSERPVTATKPGGLANQAPTSRTSTTTKTKVPEDHPVRATEGSRRNAIPPAASEQAAITAPA
jgi:hypothetical protein